MANKIVSFSPKIEIINHFDELINRVDIEFDECLEKYNEKQVLGDLECFDKEKRDAIKDAIKSYCYETDSIFESQRNCENQTEDLWSDSTKVVDYLNQVRIRTVEELKKGQEEILEYYKLNSSRIKSEEITDENKIEEMRSKLYGEKFFFQIRNIRENTWIFNLFTFVTDFYMSQSDVNLLTSQILGVQPFDEKMFLIGLLERHFLDNLAEEKCPNHLIFVSKRDVLNIQEINLPIFIRGIKLTCSSIDLSKLEKISVWEFKQTKIVLDDVELDGLSSLTGLNLYVKSLDRFKARNLKSLKELYFKFDGLMNQSNSTRIFEQLSNISLLLINGCFSNLNLDSLVNLEKLSLSGEIYDDFNFGLLENLSNHLQELSIDLKIDNNQISKLFDGHIFPYVKSLTIHSSTITKLEKKLFQGFPILQTLNFDYNKELLKIDNDAFSSLSNLIHLKLNSNIIKKLDQIYFSSLSNLEILNLNDNQIEFLEENIFSNLKNLKELDLSYNLLSTLNPQSFFGLGNLEKLNLSDNKLTDFDMRILGYIGKIERIKLEFTNIINKDELRNRFKDLNICVDI